MPNSRVRAYHRRRYTPCSEVCSEVTVMVSALIKEYSKKAKCAEDVRRAVRKVIDNDKFWVSVQDLIEVINRLKVSVDVYPKVRG
jgi:hypothetical protein